MSDNSTNSNNNDVIASVMRLSRALRRQPPRPPFGEGFAPSGDDRGPGMDCGHGRGECGEHFRHGFGHRGGMTPPPPPGGPMPPMGTGSAGMPGRAGMPGPACMPPFAPPEGIMRLMKTLSENDSVSSRELAELLDIRPSSLTELLARAEKKGMIIRTPDENDKRVTRVSLSEDGKKAIEQMEAPMRSHMEQITACFTDEEKTEFCRLCGKLADHIEQLNKENGGGDSFPRGGCGGCGERGPGRGHGFGRGFGHGHGECGDHIGHGMRGPGGFGFMPPPPFGGMPPFGEPPFDDMPGKDTDENTDE